MTFKRPSLYFIEYTDRLTWEKLHRAPGEPADREDFRRYVDVPTLRAARKRAAQMLEAWPFAQPIISKRVAITPVEWDYSSVTVEENSHGM